MLYIGTSTQYRFHFVNRDVLEQLPGSNRVDTVIAGQKGKAEEMAIHQEQ